MPFHLVHDNVKLPKDMTAAQCLLPSVKTFTGNGDLNLQDQDHAHLCCWFGAGSLAK